VENHNAAVIGVQSALGAAVVNQSNTEVHRATYTSCPEQFIVSPRLMVAVAVASKVEGFGRCCGVPRSWVTVTAKVDNVLRQRQVLLLQKRKSVPFVEEKNKKSRVDVALSGAGRFAFIRWPIRILVASFALVVAHSLSR
jgi:hypothetical protein